MALIKWYTEEEILLDRIHDSIGDYLEIEDYEYIKHAFEKSKAYDQIKNASFNKAEEALNNAILMDIDRERNEYIISGNQLNIALRALQKTKLLEKENNIEIKGLNQISNQEALNLLFKFSCTNEKIDITSARWLKKQLGKLIEDYIPEKKRKIK